MPLRLKGKRIIVTRSRKQAGCLIRALEKQGAQVIAIPAIEIQDPVDPRPLKKAAADAGEYDLVIFTSANAVAQFVKRNPAKIRGALCAIGPGIFFSRRRQHTKSYGDWSSDVCSSDLRPIHGHETSEDKTPTSQPMPRLGTIRPTPRLRNAGRTRKRRMETPPVEQRNPLRMGDRKNRVHTSQPERPEPEQRRRIGLRNRHANRTGQD